MKAKRIILFFLVLSVLIPPAYAADFGEDDEYLGQVVDDYINDDNVSAAYNVINNSTLDCMELSYGSVDGMVLENFSVYTEQDEGGGITVTDTFVDAVINRNRNRYLYYDFGANYFGDFKVYGWLNQDFHLASAWVGFSYFSNYVGNEQEHRNANEEYLCVQVGGSAGDMSIKEFDGGHFSSPSKVVVDDTDYWFKLEKVGDWVYLDVYTTENLRDAEGNGDWFDTELNLQTDYNFRYFYVANTHDDNQDKELNHEYRDFYLNGTLEGYSGSGHYYTVEMLDGDLGLAVLYNVTIPEDTTLTMEFSKDNVTWVDHNDVAGHDILIEGHEALDLRDLNTTNLYQRVNMTSDAGVHTPRFLQYRIVTTTAQPTTGPTAGGGLFPGLAIGISLLIIGAAYLVTKRR